MHCVGFACGLAFHAVFPLSMSGRFLGPGWYGPEGQFPDVEVALVVDYNSGMCLAGPLVTDLALCSFCFVRSRHARRQCRYGSEGLLCCEMVAALVSDHGSVMFFAGFAGGYSLRCVHFLVGRPAGRWTRLFVARLCNDMFHGPDSFSRLEVPQLQVFFTVVDFPCCGAEAFQWSDYSADH